MLQKVRKYVTKPREILQRAVKCYKSVSIPYKAPKNFQAPPKTLQTYEKQNTLQTFVETVINLRLEIFKSSVKQSQSSMETVIFSKYTLILFLVF